MTVQRIFFESRDSSSSWGGCLGKNWLLGFDNVLPVFSIILVINYLCIVSFKFYKWHNDQLNLILFGTIWVGVLEKIEPHTVFVCATIETTIIKNRYYF